eukprot:3478416-Prymnesium_polylepis.1
MAPGRSTAPPGRRTTAPPREPRARRAALSSRDAERAVRPFRRRRHGAKSPRGRRKRQLNST